MYVIDAIDLRIDMDDPRIDRIFDLLDRWRHLPAYQLERRADIFFGLFLPDVLDHHLLPRDLAVNPRLIPEFPLGQTATKRSDKADYLALSKDGRHAFLIELKTDIGSLRDSQNRYLATAVERGMTKLLHDVKSMAKARNLRARRKYFHLLQAIADLSLMELPAELEEKIYGDAHGVYECIDDINISHTVCQLEVIYVLPKAEDGKDCIDFATFAGVVEKRGELGRRFAKSLLEWARNKAGSKG